MKLFDRIKRYFAKSEYNFAVSNVHLLFQVCEYDEELWLTYDGSLVCPMNMFKEGAIDTINRLRELYLERYKF